MAGFTVVGTPGQSIVKASISNNKFKLILLFLKITNNTNSLFVILEKKNPNKICEFYFRFVEAPGWPPRSLTLKSGPGLQSGEYVRHKNLIWILTTFSNIILQDDVLLHRN
jgi:hypothetical protein